MYSTDKTNMGFNDDGVKRLNVNSKKDCLRKSQRLSMSDLLKMSENLSGVEDLFLTCKPSARKSEEEQQKSPRSPVLTEETEDDDDDVSRYFKERQMPKSACGERKYSVVSIQGMRSVASVAKECISPWYGCHFEYLKENGMLVVHFERKECENQYSSVFVKTCLMPGARQKQRVPVTTEGEQLASPRCAYFGGYTERDLANMEIYVRIYRHRGIFRRAQLVHEWSVPLAEADLGSLQTEWCKLELHSD